MPSQTAAQRNKKRASSQNTKTASRKSQKENVDSDALKNTEEFESENKRKGGKHVDDNAESMSPHKSQKETFDQDASTGKKNLGKKQKKLESEDQMETTEDAVADKSTKLKHSKGQPIEDQMIADHDELKSFYDHYKSSREMKWYNQFVFELCRHSIGEEIVVYPILEDLGTDGKRMADESREQHQEAKEALYRLEKMVGNSAKLKDFECEWGDLMEKLRDHMDKEEQGDIELIKKHLNHSSRIEIGDAFLNRKAIAPTRPHPDVPDKPPSLEQAMGLLAAPIDKFRDLFRDFPKESGV